MHRTARRFWGLAAVGGATAVGLTTHSAGFTVITLVGGLALPHILGLSGPHGAFGRHADAGRRAGGWAAGGPHRWHGVEQCWEAWHEQAHRTEPAATPPASA